MVTPQRQTHWLVGSSITRGFAIFVHLWRSAGVIMQAFRGIQTLSGVARYIL